VKLSLRNIGILLVAGLVGSATLPSLARKVKTLKVKGQPIVTENEKDTLPANVRKRFNYYFLEAARQHASGNYAEAFDLFEHARQIDSTAAETYFYLSLYQNQLKKDSLGLLYMQKAIALAPENQTYAESLAQQYIAKQQYDKAVEAYEAL